MKVITFKGGYDRNFSYLIYDSKSKDAFVIDPFDDISLYLNKAKDVSINIAGVLNTHGHFDHIQGNKAFESHGIKVISNDKSPINLGNVDIKVIKTPGHTKDSICFYIDRKVFTGDTLFVSKIGGTGTQEEAKEQFISLKKLTELLDNTIVYPGHDLGTTPTSTIENEKKNNPFIQRLNNFEDFLWLKENWGEYKKEHGLA